jgi:hypothetical protein
MPPEKQYVDQLKNTGLSLCVQSRSSSLTMKDIFYIAEVDEDSAAEIIALAVLKEIGLIPRSALGHRMGEFGGPAGN